LPLAAKYEKSSSSILVWVLTPQWQLGAARNNKVEAIGSFVFVSN